MQNRNHLAGDIATVYSRISGQERARVWRLDAANRFCLWAGLLTWLVLYSAYRLLA